MKFDRITSGHLLIHVKHLIIETVSFCFQLWHASSMLKYVNKSDFDTDYGSDLASETMSKSV